MKNYFNFVYLNKNSLNSYIKKILLKFNLILIRYDKDLKKFVYQFLKKIKIIDSGYKLIRIGAKNDGGYLIPDILNQIEYAFSPGVGSNSTFEDHLENFKIKSFLADGTVNYTGNHDFIKKNLNSFNDKDNITLETWVNDKLKDKSNDKLLLQMDIEGSEVEVLYNTDSNFLKRFKCIVIEFHHFDKIIDSFGLKIYSDIFDKILKTHFIVHIHPNNYCGSLMIDKHEIPYLLEITFINKKIVKYVKPINYDLPHQLDEDCKQKYRHLKCPDIFYK
jgi:hypothetical protein